VLFSNNMLILYQINIKIWMDHLERVKYINVKFNTIFQQYNKI